MAYTVCRIITPHHQKAPKGRERAKAVDAWVIPLFQRGESLGGLVRGRVISGILARWQSLERDVICRIVGVLLHDTRGG